MKGMNAVITMAVAAAVLLGGIGCKTTETVSRREPYNVKAFRPGNPGSVRVKVSIANQAIYVMEGDRPLMVTACTVGAPATPTPLGNFKIYNKTAKRRKYSWGYLVNESTGTVRTGKPSERRSGEKYVGYPMGYWCEFAPAYGFHAGWVWPYPKSHGCIRLHFNAAPKFFALVRNGTPVNIASRQPEDATIGRDLKRPQDYNNPEFPPAVQLSDQIFNLYKGPLFDG